MNLISLSIKRPVFAWILMSALIIFGAITFNRLGISQLPDVDFPVLSVSVNYEGASPEVVESELIDPIEERLLSIEGIKEMRSSIRQGSGRVNIDFDIDRNVDIALQEVQAALSQLRLPIGIDPPVIRKTNPEDQPILFMGATSEGPFPELLNWVDNFLLDQFRFIPGIGEVFITGMSERNIRIWPDPQKLRQYDLTVLDIQAALRSQHLESAAGQYIQGRQELRVRWLGEVTSPKDIGNILILRRGGQIIYSDSAQLRISDVARVEDGLSDIRRRVRLNEVEGAGIGVRKQRGGNEVALSKLIYQKVDELQEQLPKGYKLFVHVDMTAPTKAVVETTNSKLLIAAVVTILVCFLFLGNWQAAVNILFSIPTSIVGTFSILYFSGFTLNLFSLLALTLAISIVVDDAIMLLENIVRHYRMGKSAARAAYDGSIEILPAAVAATLAVIAVFLPVVFMDGIIGKFFFQFGVTMSAAVMLSLIEAVTITPMRASALLSDTQKSNRLELWLEKLFERFSSFYQKLLKYTLKIPKSVALVSMVLFAVSMFLVTKVKQEFVPLQDQNLILINGQAPPGSSLEFTSDKAAEVEAILRKHPQVQQYLNSMGAGGPSSEVNQFFMPVRLKPRETRKETHVEIMNELRKEISQIKQLRVSLRDFSSRGLTSGRQFPISFNIVGPDLDVLHSKSQELIKMLDEKGYTQDLDTDFKLGLPELLIKPNRAKMAERGVNIDAVASTLEVAVAGLRQGRFTDKGERFDMRIKFTDEQINSPQAIGKILVRNNFGNTIPLSELVTFEKNETYQAITRVNRQRAIGVFGNLKPGQSQGEVLAEARKMALQILPVGYSLMFEGSSAGLAESFGSLTTALLMGILIAYMILAVQFNSFVHPVSILVALPFSVTGALLMLWGTNISLNLFSFIGLIVLMGIAKKNSILLVEFTNHTRKHYQEKSVKEALLEACPVRLRPILMTSVATVAAALPLVFGNSIGQETRTPMGLAIVGGTIVSTVLTLFVVPCFYLILSKFESKRKIEL